MWTNEQLAAIEHRNSNLLISAAAGSGKTAVLVERIIQMILSGQTSVEKLLVVTYTNAAAGEMRARIESALSVALEHSPGDKDVLHDQIKKLSRSNIKTFHAFCLDVIRSHFQKIHIDPSFRMANETEKLLLVEEAIDETLEKCYASLDPDFIKFIESFSSNRDDVKIRNMVLKMHGFILSNPEPLEFLNHLSAMYSSSPEKMSLVWENVLLETFEKQLEDALLYLDEGISLSQLPGGPEVYKKTLESDREQIEKLLEACGLGLRALELSIENLKFERIASIKKDEKALLDLDLIATIKDYIRDKVVKKEIVEPIKKFFNYKTVDRFRVELIENKSHIYVLCELTRMFHDAYSLLKRSKNIMDFSDLEHFAVEILKDETICSSYKKAFDYIFVDEYQDSSAIQERIVNSIQRSNNVFMVGDVKQSIYKFRLADPTLFLEKYKSYEHYSNWIKHKGVSDNIRIDLRSNFRTRKNILDAVNDLFENIMSEKLGDIEYDDAAKLYGQMSFEETNAPYVEACVITKKNMVEEEDVESDNPLEQLKNDELEARVIARKIVSLIGTPIYFPKNKITKGCTFKDIVVLLRSLKSWTPVFEQVFLEEGVPLYADSQTGYFDTLEIKWLMAVLKVVDNPYNDLEWLIVLRSPIVGVSIETLAQIADVLSEKPFYYEKSKVFALETTEESKKVSQFIENLERWQVYSTYLPLDDLIWRIIRETGLGDYVAAMPGGISREANIKLLVDRALALKQSKLFSLPHFIHFIDEMIKNKGDMGVATTLGEEEDVVRLMSIHKSKGLEFPVVILGGLGRKFNMLDTAGDLVMHKSLGVALSHVSLDLRTKTKTLPQFAIKEQMKQETLSEEMRVLYVGLTRAVDRLIVFSTVADGAKKKQLWERPLTQHALNHASSFSDWIYPIWMSHPLVKMTWIELESLSKEETERVGHVSEKIEHWKNRLRCLEVPKWIEHQLSPVESLHERTYKPIKISVSDLKNSAMKPKFDLITMPSFMTPDDQSHAVNKGLAFHRVLECLDYKKDYSETTLEAFLKSLVEEGRMTKEFYNYIEIEKIMSFLTSELGIRIKNSINFFKETPFVVSIGDQLVQGVIDLYFETPEGIVLVDYKTDAIKGQSLSALSEKYAFQLDYYAKAIEELTDKSVIEKIIYFIEAESAYRLD